MAPVTPIIWRPFSCSTLGLKGLPRIDLHLASYLWITRAASALTDSIEKNCTVNLAFGWCWQSRWHWCLELESISWPRLIIHKALWWLPQSVQTGAAERKAYTNLSKTELKQLGTYKKLWMKIWNLESKTMSLRAVSTLWVILCSSRTRLYMMKWRIWLSRVTHAWLIGEWWIALNNSTLHILTTKSRHRLEICNNSNCDFNQ